MSNLSVTPLRGDVPDGFKAPVCQEADCGKQALWLVRGTPPLVSCNDHLTYTVQRLSEEL